MPIAAVGDATGSLIADADAEAMMRVERMKVYQHFMIDFDFEL